MLKFYVFRRNYIFYLFCIIIYMYVCSVELLTLNYNKMKISDFITKLEQYKAERGDLEMLFSVNDYWGTRADAVHHINGGFWSGTTSNGKQVRFDINIEPTQYPNEPKKQAKITFRESKF